MAVSHSYTAGKLPSAASQVGSHRRRMLSILPKHSYPGDTLLQSRVHKTLLGTKLRPVRLLLQEKPSKGCARLTFSLNGLLGRKCVLEIR